METRKATIKDVARMAGTSVATVSRVLNNTDYPVSKALRGKVEQAAAALHFSLNTTRQSRSAVRKTIGLVLPTVSNPFYVQTIQAISSVCDEKGYGLLLCDTQNSAQREQRYLHSLFTGKASGVIVSSISDEGEQLLPFIDNGMLVIQLDQRHETERSYNINFDYKQGAQIAMQYLLGKGHVRIAFATTPITRWTRKQLYKGYLEQMKHAGLQIDNTLIFIHEPGSQAEDSLELAAGRQIAERIAGGDGEITAVFCVNDMVAFGLMRRLHELGVRVPEDISVVGFDNIPLSQILVPALTTIHCASYETGRLAALMLIDLIESKEGNGKMAQPLNMSLQPSLIERESVASLLCR